MAKYTFYVGPTVDYIIEHTSGEPRIVHTHKREYNPDSSLKEPIAEVRESDKTPNIPVFENISEMLVSGDQESISLGKTWLKEGEELFTDQTEDA